MHASRGKKQKLITIQLRSFCQRVGYFIRDMTVVFLNQTSRYQVLQETPCELWALNETKVGKTAKNRDFRPIYRYISKMIEDRHIVTMED